MKKIQAWSIGMILYPVFIGYMIYYLLKRVLVILPYDVGNAVLQGMARNRTESAQLKLIRKD